MIEESRTNLLLWSEDFTQSEWRKNQGATVVSDTSAGSPLASGSAFLLTSPNGHADHIELLSAISDTGQTFTSYSFVKEGSSGIFSHRNIALGGTIQDENHFFNFSTQSFTDNPSGTAKAVQLNDGWWRISASITLNNTGHTQLLVRSAAASGTATGNVYISATQLEQASTPSTYIPTTTAQVTRAADQCSRVLGDEYNNDNFSVYADLVWDGLDSATDRYILSISDTTVPSTTRISMRISQRETVQIVVANSGALERILPLVEFPLSSGKNKVAASLADSGAIILSVNGQSGTLSAPSGLQSTASLMTVGAVPNGAAALNQGIGNVSLYPRALSSEDLNTLTALETT